MAITTCELADEILLHVFEHVAWATLPPSPHHSLAAHLRPGWAQALASVSGVCRRWWWVAKDDLLWRRLHIALLGPHLRPPWLATLLASPPVLSKKSAATIERLVKEVLSHRCRQALGHIPNNPVSQVGSDVSASGGKPSQATWHWAFMTKALDVRACLRLLGLLSQPQQSNPASVVISENSPTAIDHAQAVAFPPYFVPDPYYGRRKARGDSNKATEQDEVEHHFKRAVVLGCESMIEQLLPFMAKKEARVDEHLAHLVEALQHVFVDNQLLLAAALANNTALARVCLERRHHPMIKSDSRTPLMASPARVAVELGHIPIVDLVLSQEGQHRAFGPLFTAACKSGRLDVVELLWPFVCNNKYDWPSGARKAAKAGQLHVIQFLHNQNGIIHADTVKQAVEKCRGEIVSFVLSMGLQLSRFNINFNAVASSPDLTFPFLKQIVEEGRVDLRTRMSTSSHYTLFAKWPMARANEEVCRYLVDRGVNINAMARGSTALLAAVRRNDMAHAGCLVRCGAKPNLGGPSSDERRRLGELLKEGGIKRALVDRQVLGARKRRITSEGEDEDEDEGGSDQDECGSTQRKEGESEDDEDKSAEEEGEALKDEEEEWPEELATLMEITSADERVILRALSSANGNVQLAAQLLLGA